MLVSIVRTLRPVRSTSHLRSEQLPNHFSNKAKQPRGPRVFVGLVEVAGYYTGLVRGLRELGVSVSHVNTSQNAYYPCPSARGSWVVVISNLLTRLFHLTQNRRIAYWLFMPVRSFQLLMLFVWAVLMHDVFIFSFGSSFFGLRELPLLKLLGKRLIFVFSGSDTRPPYLSGLYVADPVLPLPSLVAESAASKDRVTRIEKYADFCVNHPLSAQFHEKPFVNFLKIGNPSCFDVPSMFATSAEVAEREGVNAFVRVLHAPSRPILKGSVQFSQMINQLKATRSNLEYVELRNRPHGEVLQELARCDFVLDELYSDMPLAGLATEAASFGKPALVGGYGAEALREACRGTCLPMDTYLNPEDVATGLDRLIADRDWRARCGEEAKKFVAENWQPHMLAEKFLRLISGSAPQDWMFDPQEITYFHGWGVSEERLRKRLAELIAFAGVGALQLDDKPDLKRAVMDFAQISSAPFSEAGAFLEMPE
jgi:glycosyltransferase involved in cell wall biosynthesis